MAIVEQPFRQVRSDESGAAGEQGFHLEVLVSLVA
jgi:hypothetical protein